MDMNRKHIKEFMKVIESLFIANSLRYSEVLSIKRELTMRYGHLLKDGDLAIRSAFNTLNN